MNLSSLTYFEYSNTFNNKLDVTYNDENLVFNDDLMMLIAKRVYKFYNIPISEINTVSRKREIITPRQVTHYFLKNKTKYTLAEIGKKIGDKDHATVLNSAKLISNLIDTDAKTASQIEFLEVQISKIINNNL